MDARRRRSERRQKIGRAVVLRAVRWRLHDVRAVEEGTVDGDRVAVRVEGDLHPIEERAVNVVVRGVDVLYVFFRAEDRLERDAGEAWGQIEHDRQPGRVEAHEPG